MPSGDLFYEIGRLFSSSESPLVLSALRQEPLVWQSLQNREFLQAAVERSSVRAGGTSEAGFWTPARLALLALGDPRPVDALRAEPMAVLGPSLQELALQAYQNMQRTGQPPATLRDAALLALTLRERRRLTGAWTGMIGEILPREGDKTKLAVAERMWRAPLAILYGLIPDPEEMLRSLLCKNAPHAAFAWAVHAQLCQPLSESEHAQIFTRLLHNQPVVYQLNLLRTLSLYGRESLAAALADRLLIGHPAFASLRAQNGENPPDLAALSSRALALQQMGAFYHLAGDSTQALSLYQAAQQTLEQWQAGLQLQQLNLQSTLQERGTGPLLDAGQTTNLAASAEWLGEELGAVLVSHPYGTSIIQQVSTDTESALLQMKRALLMFGREPAVARDLARQGAAGLLEDIRSMGVPFCGDFVYSWRPQDVLHILLQLDLHEEAFDLVNALLEVRPVDNQLLHIAAKISHGLGKIDAAIQYATNAAALDPQNPDWRRELGGLWGLTGEWERSWAEWEKALALVSPPSEADMISCAQAALRAGACSRAIELSETLLKNDANNGAALGLMGQALIRQGQPQQAVSYLFRATLLSPENLAPWLALADVQRQLGENHRALETLRSAVTAVPEDPEGHLALAEACIEAGLLSDALPHLKKAFQLAPESPRAALLYGQTLRRLGRTTEARDVLESARSFWSGCPELPYEYAQVMLDMGEAEKALPVLESALRDGLPVLEGHLLYARILLGEYRAAEDAWDEEIHAARMKRAASVLRRILEREPENIEARFLAADILREQGQYEQALEAYHELAELPDGEAPHLRWRIQWGLSRTALCLGEIDTALAAIKEACQARPDSLLLMRSLAEISQQANLPQEALEAADQVLQLAPGDVENLAWYADFVAGLGEAGKAVEALERAVQIDPDRPDLLAAMAHWQIISGDLQGARSCLERLRDMDNASRADLRRAAQIYLRLEDPNAALECFERALNCDPEVPADLLFEVAQLYERLGDGEAALELAQRVLEESPENLPVILLQADLLAGLRRPQAALALLERALQIAQSEESGEAGSVKDAEIQAEGQRKMLGEIHERFTRLLLQQGSLNAALDHAEKAFEVNTAHAGRCYTAADLALALLQNDRAAQILKSFGNEVESIAGRLPLALLEHGNDGLRLFCLWIEMALETNSPGDLAGWIEEGLDHSPNDARLLAARARVLFRQGDRGEAHRWYKEAQNGLPSGAVAPLWLAQAALEVEKWNEAVAMFTRLAGEKPDEARTHFGLVRALVISAERERLCQALNCRKNAPGPEALEHSRRTQFEDAIHAVGRLANTGEVGRWYARGYLAFAPSLQNVRALASLPAQPDDIAALVSALRVLNNRSAAFQVARRHANQPPVLLQLALCYTGDSTNQAEAAEAAKRAVAANPGNPLAFVAAAVIAAQAGDTTGALEAYENALSIWPDEAHWHDAAGDLCLQNDNLQCCLLHRKQAAAQDPENPRYAYKLGQACLATESISEAVSNLERSTALDPNQADVWLALASAYHVDGRLPQALEAARKAGELNPSSAEGLLIAGETALAMEQTDLALDYARSAVRREPENASAILLLSNVLVIRGNASEGLAVIESASPAVKSVFPVALERARLIRRLHGPKAALEILEKLARDYPEEPGLLGFLAKTQAECGDLKSAEANAFKALRLNPDQPDLTLLLGRLQRQAGQLDQAVQLLSDAIRMAPENLEAYLELGSVYKERREYLQALQVYRQAMRVAPGDYQAYYQSGLILRDSKDYPAAESMLRRAAELAPENLSIRRQLVGVITLNLVHNKQEATV